MRQTIVFLLWLPLLCHQLMAQQTRRMPNILFAIADDQSYPHASAYGQTIFHTPVFDSIASKGVLFNNAFVAAPQCSPSRAAILTGRQIWQLEEAGTHASSFPKKFPVFTDALESAGYFIGYTGKPWDPGNFQISGRTRNPVGPEFNQKKFKTLPTKGISAIDYAANLKDFLAQKPADKPFFFWYGANEPHREYEEGSGAKMGLQAKDIILPKFLPDNDIARNDMLDYALEIGWFDQQLGRMLKILEAAGELDNTIVVITSDNGMPFPYAKANLQEFGIHVPLAMSGPGVRGGGRKINDLVSLIDLAPTFLDLAGIPPFNGITGKTLMPILKSNKAGKIDPDRKYILSGRERHSHARPDNLGYPARAIRTDTWLYIENFKPERWPAGDPAPLTKSSGNLASPDMKPILEGYEDIDNSPTKSFLVNHAVDWPELAQLSFAKRGAEELYDIIKDPDCLHNLAGHSNYASVQTSLKKTLEQKLLAQSDPRILGTGDVFDSYPRFGLMRPFDGFKERGKYNPQYSK